MTIKPIRLISLSLIAAFLCEPAGLTPRLRAGQVNQTPTESYNDVGVGFIRPDNTYSLRPVAAGEKNGERAIVILMRAGFKEIAQGYFFRQPFLVHVETKQEGPGPARHRIQSIITPLAELSRNKLQTPTGITFEDDPDSQGRRMMVLDYSEPPQGKLLAERLKENGFTEAVPQSGVFKNIGFGMRYYFVITKKKGPDSRIVFFGAPVDCPSEYSAIKDIEGDAIKLRHLRGWEFEVDRNGRVKSEGRSREELYPFMKTLMEIYIRRGQFPVYEIAEAVNNLPEGSAANKVGVAIVEFLPGSRTNLERICRRYGLNEFEQTALLFTENPLHKDAIFAVKKEDARTVIEKAFVGNVSSVQYLTMLAFASALNIADLQRRFIEFLRTGYLTAGHTDYAIGQLRDWGGVKEQIDEISGIQCMRNLLREWPGSKIAAKILEKRFNRKIDSRKDVVKEMVAIAREKNLRDCVNDFVAFLNGERLYEVVVYAEDGEPMITEGMGTLDWNDRECILVLLEEWGKPKGEVLVEILNAGSPVLQAARAIDGSVLRPRAAGGVLGQGGVKRNK